MPLGDPQAEASASRVPGSGIPPGEASVPAAGTVPAGQDASAKRSRTALLDRVAAPPRRALAPVMRSWRRLRPASTTGAANAGERAGGKAPDAAGLALARLTVLPAVLVVAWLAPGLPLLLFGGNFLPVPMLLISVPLAAALVVNGLRAVPARWPGLGARERRAPQGWTTWFGLLSTVAVVAGLTAWQLRESSESVIVLRDAGTYLQTGYWLAQHGSLPIPQMLAAFGGPHAGLTFGSIGFIAHGTSVVPAVTSGMPMLLAAGFWAHGVTGAGAVGPILGGLAALSFAGLVARLVGPQWAPAGALALGLCLPEQYISRSSLSETALQIVLFGGLCLLADSLVLRMAGSISATTPDSVAVDVVAATVSDTTVDGPVVGGLATSGPATSRTAAADTVVIGPVGARQGWGRTARIVARWRLRMASPDWASWLAPHRALAGLAGLALGLGALISLDGLLYLLPVIPFGAILIVGRRPQAAPFLFGFVLGAAYAGLGTFLLDRPFVHTVGSTVALAGVAAVWLVAMAVIAGQLSRLGSVRRAVPRLLGKIPLRWLPEFGAVLAAAVLIGFAVRPYIQTVHGHPSVAVAHFIATLQRQQALQVDPTRLYSEQTLYWVIWYIGLPTVLLGGFGIVLLARRCLRGLLRWQDPDGSWRMWALPLAIFCAGSAAVLWQPDIVPDQPWASRRLVVVVLPGLIIGALWAASWLAVRARSRGARPVTAAMVGLFCSAAMLVPTIATTFGLGFGHTTKTGGLHPVAQGMALQRTGAGQIDAVTQLCAQIPRKSSVVIVDRVTAERFMQAIRGMCGVPVGSMAGEPAGAISSALSAISRAGRRPVLLASSSRRLTAYGGSPLRVLDLVTTGDPHELIQLPTAPSRVRYVIWMTTPSGSGVGT